MEFAELKRFIFENWAALIALVVIITPTLTIVLNFLYKNRIEERDSKISKLEDELKKVKVNVEERQPNILFYQDRSELPSLDEQLKDTKELWLQFFGGSVINAAHLHDVFFKGRKVRLILPHPYHPAYQDMCKLFVQDLSAMQGDILNLTKLAKKHKNIEVRWYKGIISNGLIIGNPHSNENWARIEILMPFRETHSRPILRINETNAPKLVIKLKESFEETWKLSEEPEITESLK